MCVSWLSFWLHNKASSCYRATTRSDHDCLWQLRWTSSLFLFFIPDHRRRSLDVWIKDDATFAARWVLPPQQQCALYYPTHLWPAVQDEQRHGDGVWDQCAASAERQRWGACRNKREKIPGGDLTLQRCIWCLRWTALCCWVPGWPGRRGSMYLSWKSHTRPTFRGRLTVNEHVRETRDVELGRSFRAHAQYSIQCE